jgi:hypothetical protein
MKSSILARSQNILLLILSPTSYPQAPRLGGYDRIWVRQCEVAGDLHELLDVTYRTVKVRLGEMANDASTAPYAQPPHNVISTSM